MPKKRLYLSLFSLALSGCGVTIPNTKVCAVAGRLSAGADCAYTLSPKTEEMNLDEFITFLEPTETRGAALCQSAEDWNKLKTALELACKKLGSACKKEAQETIKTVGANVSALQAKVKAKKGRP